MTRPAPRLAGWRKRLARGTARARAELRLAAADPVARADLAHRLRRRAHRELRRRRPPSASVDLRPFDVPDGPVARPDLRVAVVLDAFSALAFRFEWDQLPVPRQGWREVLGEWGPHLLFVESAWAGNDRAWRLTMTQASGPHTDLVELVRWCRDRGVRTVFWNKEDPPNYDVFLQTAALFDHVFTVDADRIPSYVADLGHDRVGLLAFAAQPRIHSPRRQVREPVGEVAFAGSYFTHKHAARAEQMQWLLPAAQERGLHIFSRMAAEDERYQFPAAYRASVVGSVAYEQILTAATAYPVFLNVNSVTRSPTMCARRLFELSAAQAAVLSGPSAAIEPFFGDTVTVARDGAQARAALRLLLDQPEHRRRLALRAHRRVFDEHLYTHRVEQILRTVGLPVTPADHSVSAVVPTMRPEQVGHVLRTAAAQTHDDLELVLVTHGFEPRPDELRDRARELGLDRVVLRSADRDRTLGACMNLGVAAASGRYVAKMDDDNGYGPHYLSDLVRAFAYTEAGVVGKRTHFVHLEGSSATVLRFPGDEHRYARMVQGGTLLFPRDLAQQVPFADLPRRIDTTFLDEVQRRGALVYSTDRYNFVSRRRADPGSHTWAISDAELLAAQSELLFYGDPTTHATV